MNEDEESLFVLIAEYLFLCLNRKNKGIDKRRNVLWMRSNKKYFRPRNYDSQRKSIIFKREILNVKTVEKFYLSGVCW